MKDQLQTIRSALTAAANLIAHQYTSTSLGMTALQDASDDCLEALTALDQIEAAAGSQEPVHQFRSPRCSDWYDGIPDHHDGHGPYEVRTLYATPVVQRQEPVAWLRKNGFRFLGVAEPQDDSELPLYAAPVAQQPQAEAVPQKPKLIGWRTSDYLMETSDKDKADNWSVHHEMLPIFEGDPYTKLVASTQQVQATHQHDLAHRLRVHLANRHTLTGQEFADGVEATLAEYYAAPQQAEAVPSSDLNPDEGDPVTLWAEIWRLREAVKGPDGYATWQDAATAERIRRVRAESKQAEEAKAVPTHDDTDLIKQMLEALRSCSGVSHWPALIPTINAARKRLETPQQAEAVPSDVVRDALELAEEALGWHASGFCEDSMPELTVEALHAIRAAIAQQKGQS